jgi:hypothetical protein
MTALQREYGKHLQKFEDEFLADVEKAFRKIDVDLIPPQVDRIQAQEESIDHFVTKVVPQTIDNQSGEVSRQLKKQVETFDIERQKGKKK